jgi:hypothetical protein
VIQALFMKYFLYICFIYFSLGIDTQIDERLSVTERYIALAIQGDLQLVRDVYRTLRRTELPGGGGVWITVDVGKVNRVARRLLEKSTREVP